MSSQGNTEVDHILQSGILTGDMWDLKEIYKEAHTRIFATQSIWVSTVQDYTQDLDENKTAGDAYFSDSWPMEVKKARESDGLPAGDMARFAPIADFVSGRERQNRTDERITSLDDDLDLAADVMNGYIRYRKKVSKIPHVQSQMFQDGMIGTRAHLELDCQPSRDGTFKVHCIQRPFHEVFIQRPYLRYDSQDSAGRFHAQWKRKSELEAMYSHLDIQWGLLEWENISLLSSSERVRGDQYGQETQAADLNYPGLFYDETKNLIRLLRYWKKNFKKKFQAVDVLNPGVDLNNYILGEFDTKAEAKERALEHFMENGQVDVHDIEYHENTGKMVKANLTNIAKKKLEQSIREYVREYYSYHVISGRIELEYHEDIGESLGWIDFYPYFVHGRNGGLFARIKDEAIQINYTIAKLIERLGRFGKIPVIMEDGAFDSVDSAIARFEKHGVMVVNEKGGVRRGAVKFGEDKTLSSISPYLGLAEHLQGSMDKKVGSDQVQQGTLPSSATSGKAINLLQQSGSAILAPPFDNYKHSRQVHVEKELDLLGDQFEQDPDNTALKVYHIVKGQIADRKGDKGMMALSEKMGIGGSDIKKGLDIIKNILHNIRNREFSIEIEEIESTPSYKMQLLLLLAQVAKLANMQIPKDVIMRLAPLPQRIKDEWVASMEQVPVDSSGRGGLGNSGLDINQLFAE